MDRTHIAAQLYTVREFMKTADDIRRTLKLIRGIGYEAVQLSGIGPIDPLELKGICDGLGLCICATHVSNDLLHHDLSQIISEHKIWNCRYVGIGSISPDYAKTMDGYTRYAREISAIGTELRKHGLVLRQALLPHAGLALQDTLVVMGHHADEAGKPLLPVFEDRGGPSAAGGSGVALDQGLQVLRLGGILDRTHAHQLQVRAEGEVPGLIQHPGHTSGHAGSEVSSGPA